tara:strand:- start:94 stop:204 length:111 start_codon:yes stop_codon:yes gene_type:complete
LSRDEKNAFEGNLEARRKKMGIERSERNRKIEQLEK